MNNGKEDYPEAYKDHTDSYQRNTGPPKAVKTSIEQLISIPIAVGIMDFHFYRG